MKISIWWATDYVGAKSGKLKVSGPKTKAWKPLIDVIWNVKKIKHALPLMFHQVNKKASIDVIILVMIK